jgi:geranylgeranyl pyrophosphate synthase
VLLATERDPQLIALLEERDRSLERVMPILRSTGSIDDALATARRFADEARADLGRLPEGEWRDALDAIVGGILAQVPDAA